MVRDEGLARRLVVRRGVGGNCTYDEGAKRELIEACLRGGHSIAKVARAYGLNANQLHNWIALYRKTHGRRVPTRPANSAVVTPPAFIPVVTMPSPSGAHELRLRITLANGVRVDLSSVRRDDIPSLLSELSGLPCSASTRD